MLIKSSTHWLNYRPILDCYGKNESLNPRCKIEFDLHLLARLGVSNIRFELKSACNSIFTGVLNRTRIWTLFSRQFRAKMILTWSNVPKHAVKELKLQVCRFANKSSILHFKSLWSDFGTIVPTIVLSPSLDLIVWKSFCFRERHACLVLSEMQEEYPAHLKMN